VISGAARRLIALTSAALLTAASACGGGTTSTAGSALRSATAPAVTSTLAPTALPSVAAIPTPPPATSPTPSAATATTTAPTLAPIAPTLAPTVPTAMPASGGQAVTIRAVASQFVPASATLPTGSIVTLTFENQDAGVAHDIEIFDPSSAEVARTAIAPGPDTQTITFMLGGPGRYSFKCALHPTKMNGAFAVQ